MLFNLAFKNIKKSLKDYSIYFFTLVTSITIFYLFNSLDAQDSMLKLTESKQQMAKNLVMIISYVSVFVSVILGFLIVYSNNFLVKRRKKEIGLYLTLGMSKRKVSTIFVLETFIVGLASLVVGSILGIGLSQVLSVFTAKLFEVDMTSFKFVFSKAALLKTLLYYSVIFILVMIFNVISLNRYKLIDLLHAERQNEKVRFRNKYVLFITFLVTIFCYYKAYKLLFAGAMYSMDKTMLEMIIYGAIGTFTLFFSLSGVLLSIIKLFKNVYYKGLNIFVLKQVNSKVNTTVISTTIISLMLLLTIGILSGSMSFVNVFNDDLGANNITDFTAYSRNTSYEVDENGNYKQVPLFDMNDLVNNDEYNELVDRYTMYDRFEDKNVSMKQFLDKDGEEKLIKDFKGQIDTSYTFPIIKYSAYKNIVNLYGMKDLDYDLADNEYIFTGNMEKMNDYIGNKLKNNVTINLNGTTLKPKVNEMVSIPLFNFNSAGNDGCIVVNDELLDGYEPIQKYVIGFYKDAKNEDAFIKMYNKYNDENLNVYTREIMEASCVGVKAIMTFVGLYLGIIFSISSATVLAIGQLSESSDNKERYKVLKDIGTSNSMINKALFTQIAIAFILPLLVALVHAVFGLKELNGMIEMFGHIDLSKNIFTTAVFVVIVYGGYFLATFFASKNIIKD